MTGPPEPPSTEPQPDEPDPEQARMRALLADLGTDGAHPPGPVPDDVAARLDATLADLTAPAAAAAAAPVRHRDRHRGRGLLVAAAVVLVVGAGGVTTAGLVGGSADETATSGGESAGSSADESRRAPGAVPELRRTSFTTDVAALLASRTADEQARPSLAPCASPPGRGTLVPVRFEGQPAVLVARPAQDSRQVVEAWTCDASRVLATTRVPAPPR